MDAAKTLAPSWNAGIVFYWMALVAAFFPALLPWLRHSLGSEIDSHNILMPFVTGYLIWIKRDQLDWRKDPDYGAAGVLATAGAALYAVSWIVKMLGESSVPTEMFEVGISASQAHRDDVSDANFLAIGGFVALVAAGIPAFYSGRLLRQVWFPMAMLVFMLPVPDVLRLGAEEWLQHRSADFSQWVYALTPVAVERNGLLFKLPTITLHVARECSGIRSTYVLVITSLLAGYLFLESSRRRVWLTLLVVPLGLIRNAVRIVTIGLLCTWVGPHMIDSWVHKRGGPFFFALSLIPFFGLLFWLRRSETRELAAAQPRRFASGHN